MQINFGNMNLKSKKVAVALSGGSDSMALLHVLNANADFYDFSVCAINVEHGIRGEESIADSSFVKDYCNSNGIPLLTFSVDCINYARENKLSVEQAGRVLRYGCFEQAISQGFCDVIATAHHLSDNAESVLFNLFRGTGLKGLFGIADNVSNKIIRPLLEVSKDEINEYVKKHNIPFVKDSTNDDDKYTRNFIRLNIIPKIKEIFPQAEKSIMRLSSSVKEDGEFLDNLAKKCIESHVDGYYLRLPLEPVLIKRATIIILQLLGIEKDWQQTHLNDVVKLSQNSTSKSINLLGNVVAVKEYNRIFFYQTSDAEQTPLSLPISEKTFEFYGRKYQIKRLTSRPKNLKDGFFIDRDKIPDSAVIRTKQDGDVFTKFGGGTKKLNDYFTDKKIPTRLRNCIPLIADGNEILALFNLAISEKVRVDDNTKNILQIT